MKKLIAAFAFLGLMACGSEAPGPRESALESETTTSSSEVVAAQAEAEAEAAASARVCPVYAPRCCGYTRPDGTCVGNCVSRNAECP